MSSAAIFEWVESVAKIDKRALNWNRYQGLLSSQSSRAFFNDLDYLIFALIVFNLGEADDCLFYIGIATTTSLSNVLIKEFQRNLNLQQF